MEVLREISVGEIVQSLLMLMTLVSAVFLYITQIALNKRLLSIESFVEVTARLGEYRLETDGKKQLFSHVEIKSYSKTHLYLTEYEYGGDKYKIGHSLVYDTSPYYIELPSVENGLPYNSTMHRSIKLKFVDSDENIYEKELEANFVNGKWVIREYRLEKK